MRIVASCRYLLLGYNGSGALVEDKRPSMVGHANGAVDRIDSQEAE